MNSATSWEITQGGGLLHKSKNNDQQQKQMKQETKKVYLKKIKKMGDEKEIQATVQQLVINLWHNFTTRSDLELVKTAVGFWRQRDLWVKVGCARRATS